jgi:hypothetical protein
MVQERNKMALPALRIFALIPGVRREKESS